MTDQKDDERLSELMELRAKKFEELVDSVKQFGKSFAIDPRQVVVQLTEKFKTKRLVPNDQSK
jgi:hypothetical protein